MEINRNEQERLAELRRFRILDTPKEQVFDDFVELAAQLSNCSEAIISLVDEDRQWFKASKGIKRREVPRAGSLAEPAMASSELFCVEDASKDPRFSGNPFVDKSPGVRFYAAAPLISQNGFVLGVLAVIDIKSRQLAENAKRCLMILAQQIVSQMERRLLIDSSLLATEIVRNSPAAIFCKEYSSGKGVFVEWNRSAEELWSLPQEEMLGKTDYDLFPVAQADFFLEKDLETLKEGKTIFIEREEVDTPKGTIVVRTWKVPLKDSWGNPRYILGISTDITRQEQLQKDMLEAQQEAFNAAKTKAAFLANMSHEIRTPMNGILGMTNLMMDSVVKQENVERLNIIRNCGNDLLGIINNILDFSKLEADRVDLEKRPFNVCASMEELVSLNRVNAEAKGISISYHCDENVPEWIASDEIRIRQVMNNLLTNAVKFTEVGGITVDVSSRTIEDSVEIEVSVADTGIGIPGKLKSKLFVDFSQVDASTTRKFGGSGLGLAISKGICEKLGGSINVVTSVGQGSCFTFTFKAEPCDKPADTDPLLQTDSELEVAGSILKILIADDNEVNCQVAQGLLEKLGHESDVVVDGRQAVERLKKQHYDLVLMDCNMPVMDGYEATRVIRKLENKEIRPIKVVALTASTMPEEVKMCFSAGMDYFVAKPLTLESLRQALFDITSVMTDSTGTSEKSYEPVVPATSSEEWYDRKKFLEGFDGDEDIALDIARKYTETWQEELKALDTACRGNNGSEVARIAHGLKGAVAIFCADAISTKAYELELAAKNSDMKSLPEHIKSLGLQMESLAEELSRLIETG